MNLGPTMKASTQTIAAAMPATSTTPLFALILQIKVPATL
jgi:hypothetical protein